MKIERTLVLLLVAGAAGATSCTAILGTFDFEGEPVGGGAAGTGGSGGSTGGTGGTSGGAGGTSGASCTDQVKNGDETDIDCGGTCGKCALNQSCTTAEDCAEGVCAGSPKTCQAPTCTDDVRNGDETDVDCGGSTCPACGKGKGCLEASDCEAGEHGTPTCDGTCGFECATGYDDCDGATGCETDVTTKDHCGSCTVSCSAYCVAGSCNDPVAVTGGNRFSCALLHDGTVWCWGMNSDGQLGDGTTTNSPSPQNVSLPMAATAVVAGVAGASSTCALLADKTLRCWGDLYGSGQDVPLANVIQVSLGVVHACAIDTDQKLYCWGENDSGQLGTGDWGPRAVPTHVMSDVKAVAAGSDHTCAIKTAGTVYCWGTYGTTETNTPPAVPVINNALEVVAGGGASCARTTVGVFCWGVNGDGQLGLGTNTPQSTPQPVSVVSATQIAMGRAHVGAVTASGLFMWGDNQTGQLGDGTGVDRWSPVLALLSDVAAVSCSWFHSCAITKAHQLFCWGDNNEGALGDGTTAPSSAPVPVVWP